MKVFLDLAMNRESKMYSSLITHNIVCFSINFFCLTVYSRVLEFPLHETLRKQHSQMLQIPPMCFSTGWLLLPTGSTHHLLCSVTSCCAPVLSSYWLGLPSGYIRLEIGGRKNAEREVPPPAQLLL